MTPQSYAIRRSPRVRVPSATPVALRTHDGGRAQGELKVFSLTGGLVGLRKPLDCRSLVELKFMTPAGRIRGSAEMLKPVSEDLQPFRFVTLDRGDQRKLRRAIQSHMARSRDGHESMDKYRTKLAQGTFFGNLLGYDPQGDDVLGVNRDPEQNCPICGIAGHNHSLEMSKECAAKLLSGDDQTGKASKPKLISHSRISSKKTGPA